ncbi:MAG: GTP-binding protein [Lachnospiraceae bacterium]|nr:GTP-binding protein [Lachnospiraceae bacterium]
MVFGIVAHVDAGKTTLSEALLYNAGQLKTIGRVDHGDAYLDTDDMERERGITIFSKQARIAFGEQMVTLLDTPGHVDFSAEMERALMVLDYAVLVISGTDGVQGHTRTLYRLLKHYQVPMFIFVNKMDMDGTSRDDILRQLKEEFSDACVDFSKPFSEFDEDTLEEIAVTDEALLERYMESGTIEIEDIRDMIAQRKLFPCFFGSALLNQGVDTLLEGLKVYTKEPDWAKEFSARVYKITRDEKGQRLTHLKVTGGSLCVKDKIQIADCEEKAEQLRLYSGEKFENVQKVCAGEVCAVCGFTKTYAGQSLGAEAQEQAVETLLEPVLRYRIDLPTEINPMEFFGKLKELEEEDPKLSLIWDEEHKEILVQMMGQVQIEILTRMIQSRFGVTVVFGKGSIVYKETIAEPVEGVGHFEPLRHYAEVHLLLEPAEPGSGITVHSVCSEDDLALNWQRLIATHVMEREHRGVLTGSALCDVKVTILSGRAHPKHTEGGDFRKATYRAIRHGLCRTKSILLEPYYAFVLEIPSEHVGRAMTDINNRFGKQEAPEYLTKGSREMVIIRGSAPVSAMQDYVNEVHAYSQGLGSLSLTLKGYDVCHNAEEVIEEIGYDAQADLRNPASSVFCAHGAGFVVPWDEVENYMHLPYSYQDGEIQKAKDGYAYDSEAAVEMARRAAEQSTTARLNSLTTYELDQELKDVYQRTFGKSEKEIEEERRIGRLQKKSVPKAPTVKLDKKGNPIYPQKDKREQCLIVDGYNVIFASHYLKDLANRNIDSARDALCDALCNYQGYRGGKLLVVFDAYKRKDHSGSHLSYHNIEIWYTRTDETADAFIERYVHQEEKHYQFTVATSDGLEQLTVMSAGALRMPSKDLLKELKLE